VAWMGVPAPAAVGASDDDAPVPPPLTAAAASAAFAASPAPAPAPAPAPTAAASAPPAPAADAAAAAAPAAGGAEADASRGLVSHGRGLATSSLGLSNPEAGSSPSGSSTAEPVLRGVPRPSMAEPRFDRDRARREVTGEPVASGRALEPFTCTSGCSFPIKAVMDRERLRKDVPSGVMGVSFIRLFVECSFDPTTPAGVATGDRPLVLPRWLNEAAGCRTVANTGGPSRAECADSRR